MKRTILHSDLNNFYASVECLHRPELRDKPVAVTGDVQARHGIVLAKNGLAKASGIQTGEAIWQARQKCPDLVTLPANFALYQRFAQLARNIYLDYTDQVEPFGIDEAWLDVSGCVNGRSSGTAVAHEIRRRIKREIGVTVSIGVSWNKIFAKLGSDMKKPDAITVLTEENYREKVWPLPAKELLYVGRATSRKLTAYGIDTIGELAGASPTFLRHAFGKWGDVLHIFSNGWDQTPVAKYDELAVVKSIGNSSTTPRDLVNNEDVKMLLYVLCESVSARMREQGFEGRTVTISVRDNQLFSFTRQQKLRKPTCLTSEIAGAAMELFLKHYQWQRPIRSMGVSMSDFQHEGEALQLDVFSSEEQRLKRTAVERTVDDLRRRYGNYSIQRAVLLRDPDLTRFDPKRDHTIHPVGYF